MRKLLFGAALAMFLSSPAYAWYDGYGNYHCTYLDPITSFFDSIFGQPCYVVAPPTVVVQAPPVVVEQPVPVPVPVPEPYPVPMPVYPYPY